MFGPNTHIKSKSIVSYSHRDNEFFDLYKDTVKRFKKIFNLNNYDILMIPGSGTIGIESVIYSLKDTVRVVGCDGVFFRRWKKMIEAYNKTGNENNLYCQLETSVSQYNIGNDSIVDGISSFPYYDVPEDTEIFITCGNKQLGTYPGLAIVCVRKDFWNKLINSDVMSYLNLSRYRDYSIKNQTPSTAPTHLFNHFNKILRNFNISELRNKINNMSDLLVNSIGSSYIIGEKRCPVITVNKDVIPIELANKYQLYGINTDSENYQFFTYSCDEKIYKRFCKELCQY
tara:strand:- start:464 stop:1321 length:858 start_codon:yes stop_codon:yes gene_type:complete